MNKHANPSASQIRPFLIKEVQMDLDLVNTSLKMLGDMELTDDTLREIAKLKEEVCQKLLELDDYIYSIYLKKANNKSFIYSLNRLDDLKKSIKSSAFSTAKVERLELIQIKLKEVILYDFRGRI